jgi:AraC family transcriptional regulator of adaptative response/methylated-DNA-[protein]-cysteine methyltransferase
VTGYEETKKVIRYLSKHYREQPNLRALAGVVDLSEFHFHRLFTRWAGITPKAFVKFLTAKHAKELLRQSRSILDASLESGLSGPGRLHDLLVSVEGVTPGEFKTQGRDIVINYGFHPSPFGTCLIGVTARGVCHIAFLDQENRDSALRELRTAWPNAIIRCNSRLTAEVVCSVFRNKKENPDHSTSVFLVGTPFQLKVWEAVLRVPPGFVLTYRDIGKAIGSPGASRAVGSALARNPVAYLIPCHRVIRETGTIGDYRWGSARKRAILSWERSGTPRGDDPEKSISPQSSQRKNGKLQL